MAKILALEGFADISGLCVTMDTAKDRDIVVRLDSGKFWKFKQFDEFFYCFGMEE